MNHLYYIMMGTAVLTFAFLLIKTKHRLANLEIMDSLTGGYNRSGFLKKAHGLLDSKKGSAHRYWVVNMNIVDFKSINKKFGEKAADEILAKIYRVFKSYIKKDELLCRSGIDYFLFLLHKESEEAAESFVEQMIRDIHGMQRDAAIDFMIGICEIRESEILQNAIYKATYIMDRSDVLNRCMFYDEKFEKQETEKRELLDSFEMSIQNEDFCVYLQPIVPVNQQYPVSAEALVRWVHPKKGFLSPDRFISLLEDYNRIAELDLYMFEAVCKMIETCIFENRDCIEVSVNLSRIHLKQKGLEICRDYQKIKSRYKIPDGIMKLEITENSMFELDDIEMVKQIIDGFHAIGLKVGLDDFGYAYSSVELLKDFDIDILKLDRSFFTDENMKSYQIVKKIIELAHELGIAVVAEGIEEEDQVKKLCDLNCDYVQGYFFSKPIPPEEFIQWVHTEIPYSFSLRRG